MAKSLDHKVNRHQEHQTTTTTTTMTMYNDYSWKDTYINVICMYRIQHRKTHVRVFYPFSDIIFFLCSHHLLLFFFITSILYSWCECMLCEICECDVEIEIRLQYHTYLTHCRLHFLDWIFVLQTILTLKQPTLATRKWHWIHKRFESYSDTDKVFVEFKWMECCEKDMASCFCCSSSTNITNSSMKGKKM